MFRKLMVVSVSMASLAVAQSAAAQSGAAPEAPQNHKRPAANAQVATADAEIGSSGGIADIIVTATRQATALQRTPIAVTAVTTGQLEARGLTNSADLGAVVPNAAFRRTGGVYGPGLSAFIRGIGQYDTGFASEPGVAFYIDDVYYPLVYGSLLDLLDLDHVEVLRGPQGTLFGRNALAGAINIVSRKPSLTDASSYAEVTVGSYNRRDFRAGFNMPLSDTVAIAVSGLSQKRRGYEKQLDFRCQMIKNGTPELAGSFPFSNGLLVPDTQFSNPANSSCVIGHLGGQDVRAVRGQALWEPVSNLQITLTGDYTKDESDQAADRILTIDAARAANNANARTLFDHYTVPGGPTFAYDSRFVIPNDRYATYATYTDPIASGTAIPGNSFYNGSPFRGGQSYAAKSPFSNWGISGKAVYGIDDDIDLTLVGGYREFKAVYPYDVDGTPLGLENDASAASTSSYTGELRISGKKGWIDWVTGLFYYRGTERLEVAVSTPWGGVQLFQHNRFKPESKAAYANVTVRPLSGLSLTAGARYSDDRKPVSFMAVLDGTNANSTSLTIASAGNTIFDLGIGDKHADWKLGANYQITDHTLVYASASTGSRLPGFNTRPLQANQAVQYPGDKTQAYELGIKTDLFDRRLRFNGAFFYTDYKQRTISINGQEYQLDANGNRIPGGFVVVDSPSAPGVTVCQSAPSGTQGYACVGRTFFVNAPGKVKGVEGEIEFNPIDELMINGSFGYSKFTAPDLEARPANANHRLNNIPEWTANAGIQYKISVPGLQGDITPRLDWFYQGSIVYSPTLTAYNQPGYSLFNGRITYTNDEHQFNVAIGVTNIFNKFYYRNFFIYQDLGYPSINGQPAPPREWLLTVGKKF